MCKAHISLILSYHCGGSMVQSSSGLTKFLGNLSFVLWIFERTTVYMWVLCFNTITKTTHISNSTHSYWWLGEGTRSQGISNYGIDLLLPEYYALYTTRFNLISCGFSFFDNCRNAVFFKTTLDNQIRTWLIYLHMCMYMSLRHNDIKRTKYGWKSVI